MVGFLASAEGDVRFGGSNPLPFYPLLLEPVFATGLSWHSNWPSCLLKGSFLLLGRKLFAREGRRRRHMWLLPVAGKESQLAAMHLNHPFSISLSYFVWLLSKPHPTPLAKRQEMER